jgi:hypothetical protein
MKKRAGRRLATPIGRSLSKDLGKLNLLRLRYPWGLALISSVSRKS